MQKFDYHLAFGTRPSTHYVGSLAIFGFICVSKLIFFFCCCRYCIALTKLKTKDVDDYIDSINICEAEKRISNKISLNSSYDCIMSRPNHKDMERYQLKKLIPGHNYVIQVMLTIDKEFVSYQTLKIYKGRHCYVPILNDQNQLPNIQPNLIEGNRILVP